MWTGVIILARIEAGGFAVMKLVFLMENMLNTILKFNVQIWVLEYDEIIGFKINFEPNIHFSSPSHFIDLDFVCGIFFRFQNLIHIYRDVDFYYEAIYNLLIFSVSFKTADKGKPTNTHHVLCTL